ncbi:DUF1294 domain-containing protein [Pseudoalteromonas ardens]|uniref:DUF1294 domain-containing protein n=1 Tax=Pseudoalteromonas rubra TaxID=43658 RepID=A0A0L0EVV3_9GAMM|nr:DUF1294 domain-containing protein [Pseudoalteromonas sp. R96]KNC68003.1 hypothetical protein AC626_07395 [Pseudoalteromonas rubra]MDK1309702.1 DUF1294 domain-containing protein [Pseudoalteromonas sp. R96]
MYKKYFVYSLLQVSWGVSAILMVFAITPNVIALSLPAWSVPVYLLLSSAIVFGVYGRDKALSKKGAERISERLLLIVSASSLHLATLQIMSVLRHKTIKLSFLLKLLTLQLLQVIAFVYVLISYLM